MLRMLPCQVSRLMVLSSIVLKTGVTKCQGVGLEGFTLIMLLITGASKYQGVGLEGFDSNYASNYRGDQMSGGWFRGGFDSNYAANYRGDQMSGGWFRGVRL